MSTAFIGGNLTHKEIRETLSYIVEHYPLGLKCDRSDRATFRDKIVIVAHSVGITSRFEGHEKYSVCEGSALNVLCAAFHYNPKRLPSFDMAVKNMSLDKDYVNDINTYIELDKRYDICKLAEEQLHKAYIEW